jgi:succinyl-CoA synthetase alpha subunit
MKISNSISKLPGITQAAVVMATELNRRVLSEAGFADAAIGAASTSDMIVAIESKDAASLDAAIAKTEKLLTQREEQAGEKALPTSLEEALELVPDANLAVISVPGQFAKREAMRALDKGLNVFLFSSNVSQEEEVELKKVAKEKRLLMMGPDCGTSIINHKVLGFGNTIREGTIGLVSASGTGLQEVSTLIHKAGLGIS